MKNRINVAELLKNCPTGMELNCTVYEDVKFDKIDEESDYPIRITIGKGGRASFTKFGQWSNSNIAKCVIFPKGKTTWEGFHRPFKDGDILVYKHKSNNVKYTFIYKRRIDMHYLLQYCGWFQNKPYLSEQFNAKERMPLYENDDIKFATEEEKEKLFQAIKDNGYKWNIETKILEKLAKSKFKVGDRIKKNKDYISGIITNISDDGDYKVEYQGGGISYVSLAYQDEWELIPNKFDINTLVPFESRVLVRDYSHEIWRVSFWGCLINSEHGFKYDTIRGPYKQCIPYESNEHLLGKMEDCADFYKNW